MFQRLKQRARQVATGGATDNSKSASDLQGGNIAPADGQSEGSDHLNEHPVVASNDDKTSDTSTNATDNFSFEEDPSKEGSIDGENEAQKQLEAAKKVLSRWRTHASKAVEVSASMISDAVTSSSHAPNDQKGIESRSSYSTSSNNSNNADPSLEPKDRSSPMAQIAEEEPTDPKILRLDAQIQQLRFDLKSMKSSGTKAQRRRDQEVTRLRQETNGKSRELWMNMQKMRRFVGLKDYKTQLKRCSLPAHDQSLAVINEEAKLARAQHKGAVLEHQLQIVHNFQQGMIDYLYTKALPDLKAEHSLAAEVGKAQVEKMAISKEIMVNLFEDCLGLQRKVLAKYKLRELEQSRHLRTDDEETIRNEKEQLQVMAGEIPAMERDSGLRDSAKRRLAERMGHKDRLVERRRSRDEEIHNMADSVHQSGNDRTALEKAQEQIEKLSSHPIDTLLNVDAGGEEEFGEASMATDMDKNEVNDTDNGTESGNRTDNTENNEAAKIKLEEMENNPIGNKSEGVEDSRRDLDNEGDRTGDDEPETTGEPAASAKMRGSHSSDLPRSHVRGAGRNLGDSENSITMDDTDQNASSSNFAASANLSRQVARRADRNAEVSQNNISDGNLENNRSSNTFSVSARLRARREGRNMEDSETSISIEDSERSRSEKDDDDNLEAAAKPRTPVSSRRPNRSSTRLSARSSKTTSGDNPTASRGRGSRSDLLQRARSARLYTEGSAGADNDGGGGGRTMRPSLGNKAISSRDIGSRRMTARPSTASRRTSTSDALGTTSDHLSSTRPSLAASSDRQDRMERMASRRRLTDTDVGGRPANSAGEGRGGLSAERRAQLRSRVSAARGNADGKSGEDES